MRDAREYSVFCDGSLNCHTFKMVQRLRIAFWMSEKKCQKINWVEFEHICQKYGFELVKIDFSRPLEEQGPFKVFIHKLTDVVALSDRGDLNALKIMRNLQNYLKRHPEVLVIDPIENVKKVMDRFVSYTIANTVNVPANNLLIPTFTEINSKNVQEIAERLQQSSITYPFICKPAVGHGSDNAHKMSIIFNESHLGDLKPPCVVQSFVNHDAVLYKIYVVGNVFQSVQRSSLKNFYPDPDRETIFFHSNEISKSDSNSYLTVLDDGEVVNCRKFTRGLNNYYLERIVKSLRLALNMQLFGFDLIIENVSGRYAIIDINIFPSYDGFPNYNEHLINCIINSVQNHR